MYRATANYRIGVCFEFAGRRDSAIVYYRAATRSDRKFGDDAYSVRKSELRLESRLQAADSLLIVTQNAVHSGNYDDAIKTSSSITALSGVSSDMLLEAEYLRAESYFEKKSYAEALHGYQSMSGKTAERELWLIPWSHYQSGLCLLKLNNPTLAKKEFEQAQEYDEYDFHNWLEFRTKRELEKIEKKSNQ